MKSSFAIDWTNKQAVLAYCKELNKSAKTPEALSVVYKHPSRNNYNITFASRADARYVVTN